MGALESAAQHEDETAMFLEHAGETAAEGREAVDSCVAVTDERTKIIDQANALAANDPVQSHHLLGRAMLVSDRVLAAAEAAGERTDTMSAQLGLALAACAMAKQEVDLVLHDYTGIALSRLSGWVAKQHGALTDLQAKGMRAHGIVTAQQKEQTVASASPMLSELSDEARGQAAEARQIAGLIRSYLASNQ